MNCLRGPVAALLSLSLLCPATLGPAATPGAAPSRSTYQSAQLQGDARILHALNRFTFGPRPGDLEAVRSIGLDAWFESQLHPASLDLSDLNARLAQFPAMQLSTEDLLYRLPSNALLRQMTNRKLDAPQADLPYAIYTNQMERIQARREQQQQQNPGSANPPQQPAAAATSAGTNAMGMEATTERAENPTPMAQEPAPRSGQDQMPGAAPQAAPAPLPADASLLQSLVGLSPQNRIAKLANMTQPDFDRFIQALRPQQRKALVADFTPEQKESVAALEGPERTVVEELMAQRLTRDIYSTAQLQEVMTDFWFNHFNVYLRKNEQMPYYLVSYERDTIRPLAMGKFEDLLEATAHSPAMLIYLDNATSIGPDSLAAQRAERAARRNPGNQRRAPEGLNENYARELMELHTLGVNGGYTQADVTQVARILTGWTVDRPVRGGSFQFNPNRHEPGTKKVMGRKFKDQGELEGRELLHFLATRPATAQFLCHEMAVRFVADDPPQSLVDRMAKAYMASGGDIAQVLRTLFHSPEFWSTSVYRAKVKTPIEYVVSTVRASDAGVDNLRPVANALRQMGMPLYGCIPPTGYSWKSSDWVSTGSLVDRMNFALALAANRLPGIYADWAPQPQDEAPPSVHAQSNEPIASEEARLESMLIPGGLSVSTRTALLQQFQQQSASPHPISATSADNARAANALQRQDQLLAGLLLGSPDFQRR